MLQKTACALFLPFAPWVAYKIVKFYATSTANNIPGLLLVHNNCLTLWI